MASLAVMRAAATLLRSARPGAHRAAPPPTAAAGPTSFTDAADTSAHDVAVPAGAPRDGGGDGLGDRLDRLQQRWMPVAFLFGIVKKFTDDRAGRLAALVAYYGFFSVFPMLLIMVTTLGFVLDGRPELRDEVERTAIGQLPILRDAIPSEATTPLTGNAIALVVGIVGALWAGLGAMQAAQDAMNEVWNIPRVHQPDFLRKRIRSLLTLGLVGGLLISSAVLSQISSAVAGLPGAQRTLLTVGTLALDVVVFLVAFQVLIAQRQKWRAILPGAVLAGLAYYGLQSVGRLYFERAVGGAEGTYGVFAVVIGLLSWLYVQAQITILAAEVNVVAIHRLWPRSVFGGGLTDADRRVLLAEAVGEQQRPDQRVRVSFGDDGEDSAEGRP